MRKYEIDYLLRSDEIQHHGVLGQKWGVRRYQNKNGSLTPEGRARMKNAKKIGKSMAKNLYKHNKTLSDGYRIINGAEASSRRSHIARLNRLARDYNSARLKYERLSDSDKAIAKQAFNKTKNRKLLVGKTVSYAGDSVLLGVGAASAGLGVAGANPGFVGIGAAMTGAGAYAVNQTKKQYSDIDYNTNIKRKKLSKYV